MRESIAAQSMVWTGIFSLLVGSCLWHVGDVNVLSAFEQGRKTEAFLWVTLHLLSVPFFVFSSCTFFRFQRSWWAVELPYLVAGMGVSLVLFNKILRVAISWREIAAGALILAAAYLLSGARVEEQERPSEAPVPPTDEATAFANVPVAAPSVP